MRTQAGSGRWQLDLGSRFVRSGPLILPSGCSRLNKPENLNRTANNHQRPADPSHLLRSGLTFSGRLGRLDRTLTRLDPAPSANFPNFLRVNRPMPTRPLDFGLLDDVLPAVHRSRNHAARQALLEAEAEAVGPVLEYALQLASADGALPRLEQMPVSATRGAIQALLAGSGPVRSNALALQACPVEFCRVPDGTQGPGWIAFCKRLQNAAERAGYSPRIAAGLTAAFGEMVDNVLCHSQRPRSGIVAYRWTDGRFEYVVADTGVGVLDSLRTNPGYSHLVDDGLALQTALTEGESRFGRGSGRGLGFRQVFLSLANLFGSLRFRSGDHTLVIDGTGPTLTTARLAQNVHYQGFLVSVSCATSSPVQIRR